MKTFKEFLLEANKTYAIRIKVAGDLPENFEANLKDCMEKYFSWMDSDPKVICKKLST